jgi:hypothetical protein
LGIVKPLARRKRHGKILGVQPRRTK